MRSQFSIVCFLSSFSWVGSLTTWRNTRKNCEIWIAKVLLHHHYCVAPMTGAVITTLWRTKKMGLAKLQFYTIVTRGTSVVGAKWSEIDDYALANRFALRGWNKKEIFSLEIALSLDRLLRKILLRALASKQFSFGVNLNYHLVLCVGSSGHEKGHERWYQRN